MLLVIFAICALICVAGFAWLKPTGAAEKWAKIILIWLSVPFCLTVWTVSGFYVAKLGGCSPSARAAIECTVFGVDVSGWLNSIVFGGYAFVFVALPWLVGGAVLILIYLCVLATRAWRRVG